MLNSSMNPAECCALGAMKAIHLIEQQKLIVSSTKVHFMGKDLTVYGYGELDDSKADESCIVFKTNLHLEDDPMMDHDCIGCFCRSNV